MKKLLLFLVALSMVVCFFAISVLAEEQVPDVTDTYYLVQSQDSEAAIALKNEGKQIISYPEIIGPTFANSTSVFFGDFPVGSHIEIIFGEDIFVPKTIVPANKGILINTAITVTFRYNGFSHYLDNGGGSSLNGIVVRGSGAYVRLIGSKAMDENGEFDSTFIGPKGDIANGDFNTNNCNVDVFKYDENYIDVYGSKIYIENLRSYVGHATIKGGNSGNANITIVNSALYSSRGRSVNFNDQAPKTVVIDGGYYKGLSGYTICTGSFVKNCAVVESNLHIDSWNISKNVWEFVNCDLSKTTKISSNTGRTHYVFKDCIFNPDGVTWELSGDGGGDQFVRIYKSATCTEPGSLEIKRSSHKGTSNPYAAELENFSAPALNHNYSWKNNYSGDKYVSTLTAVNSCSNCKDVKETYTVDTMFTALGYSVPEFGNSYSIIVGYQINRSAIEQYEAYTGSTISFGCVVALKDKLGEFNAPLDENGDAVVLQSGNVIKADITNEVYSYTSLKVSLTSEHTDLSLLMSAYIIETSDDIIQISYLQNPNELVKDNQFTYVSYNNH